MLVFLINRYEGLKLIMGEQLDQPLFFAFGSHTAISQPNSTYKPILNLL
jgi:hypothetical protein